MLKVRILTSLTLLAAFLVTLFLLPFAAWVALVIGVAGLGAWEWGGLLGQERPARWRYALLMALLCALLAAWILDPLNGSVRHPAGLKSIFLLASAFWLLLVPLWLLRKWTLAQAGVGSLGGVMVLIPACLALMQLRGFSPALLLAAMAAVWLADIAAYFTGRRLGRRKLAPRISPGKTYEGLYGAVLAVLIYGAILAGWTGKLPTPWGTRLFLVLGLILFTVVSALGDLFESLAKRQADKKDSGTLLPGHGGVLDRIDSLTSTLPLVGLLALFADEPMP